MRTLGIRSRIDRAYLAKVEVGPALLFLACLNLADRFSGEVVDATQEQHLVVGFLWFVAAIVVLCTGMIVAAQSISRNRSQP